MNRDHRGNYIMCNEVSSTTQDNDRANAMIIRPRHYLQYPGSRNSLPPQYLPFTRAELDLMEMRERLGEYKFQNYFVEYILPMFETPFLSPERTEKYPTRLHFISGFCAICVEVFKPNEMLVKIKCGHIFHWACMHSWVLTENGCAACNEAIIPIDAPFLFPEYRSRTLELIKAWKLERAAALSSDEAVEHDMSCYSHDVVYEVSSEEYDD